MRVLQSSRRLERAWIYDYTLPGREVEKCNVLGMAGPVEARVVVDAGAMGGVIVRLETANGSLVVFEVDGSGVVYVVPPGSGERVRVGWGVTPLYAPRPGVAAPLCLPRVWGST